MARAAVRSQARPDLVRRVLAGLSAMLVALAVAAVFAPSAAFAGQASSGELLFYPCTSCHPVNMQTHKSLSGKPLPNGFKGHAIVLEGHDKLGKGDAACLSCHDDPARNPGMLKTIDGSLIDIKGDVALVCYRCHSAKYNEWKAGTHGKHKPSCVAAGCHDPHSPGSIYAPALLPFVGGGFQVSVLPIRKAFVALAQPAPPPGIETPLWFSIVAIVGVIAAGGQVVRLARGRQKR